MAITLNMLPLEPPLTISEEAVQVLYQEVVVHHR